MNENSGINEHTIEEALQMHVAHYAFPVGVVRP